MISRRKAVLSLGAAALGSAGLPALSLDGALQPVADEAGDSPGRTDSGASAIDDRLAREIARVAFREDSEEGVPVVLACINQVTDPGTRNLPPIPLTTWSAVFASEMRLNAAAWERLRPGCSSSDVAHLIQVLAERDLAVGGQEQKA